DLAGSTWDVDVLSPVINTRLTLADLLADSLVTADSEGALRLKIEVPLIDFPLDSILQIPDTTISEEIGVPFALNDVAPGTDLPIPLTSETQYDLGDLALNQIVLREGTVKLKVKSIVETAIDFQYNMPTAYRFGAPFTSSQTVPAGSVADTAFLELEFDLSGYSVNLGGLDGSGFNTLTTDFRIKTSETGNTVSIPANPTKFLIIEYSFLNLVPEYGTGYFGQMVSETDDETSEIDVLNRITEGQMLLDSVTIDLSVVNGVGADAKFLLDALKSINNRTGTTINLNHQIIGNEILLTRAQDPNGNAEDVVPYEVNYQLNNSNSNIKGFIENLPDELGFTFGFELNPLGNISSGNDFFYYDSPFEALMDIDIPLRASLSNLTLVDTVAFNLSTTAVVETVNSGTFTLIANNGLPLGGEIELILLDENLIELDTLLVPSEVLAPPLNANNRVEEPLESRINIPIDSNTAGVLPQTKFIHIKAKFNTSNQPNLVEFYDTYGIDLKLIGRFNLNFGPSIL
ncbi:MAG: hypothetical protein ACPGD8_07185, partial [Flavobacteriales bacterium]